MWCGAVTWTRSAWKRAVQHRYGHAATASWWTERNLILPHVEAAKEKVADSTQVYTRKVAFFQLYYPCSFLHGGIAQ
jgi:hypothetical protein